MKWPLYFILSFFVLATWCCEEEGLETSNIEPYVRVQLINNDRIDSLAGADTTLTDTIEFYSDSIDSLDALIDTGENEEENQIKIDTLESKIDSLSDVRRSVRDEIDIIQSGLIWITRLTGGGGKEINFEDSSEVFRFPLDMHNDRTDFEFDIYGDDTYTISFTYQRDTAININSIVIMARSIAIFDTGPETDSVTFYPCDTIECSSNEATAIIYF